jgi:tripartite-type tricarboxylate transporter receptor subunit TctC
MNRRQWIELCAAGLMIVGTSRVFGQAYPSRPIRVVVAYPPGGQSDLIARLVAQRLGVLLGVSVIVENRPGASGAVGVEAVARAPADGYTLLLGSGGNLTLGPVIDSTLHYDTARDFAPIARVARAPLVLAARADLPVSSLSELIAYARRNPGKLTYASGATATQIAIEALKVSAGLDIVYVPYKGTAPAMLDIAAGRVDIGLVDVAVVAPYVAAGTAKVLANAGATRARSYPQVPTAAEQGVPGFEWSSWHGLLVPAGTPAEAIATLQSAARNLVASAEFRDGLAGMGFDPIVEDPSVFPAFLREETQRYKKLASLIELRVER